MKRKTVILAAGKGTRMPGDKPKVLYTLASKPLIGYSIETAQALNAENIIVIVGYQRELVTDKIKPLGVQTAIQDPQLGTGHALMQAEPLLKNEPCNLLVLCGDVPLLRPQTLIALFAAHEKHNADATILTTLMENPTGYGRVLRNNGEITAIIEERDAGPEIKRINEINSGIYIFKSPLIFEILRQIKPGNVQKEYYLTDAIALLLRAGKRVMTLVLENPDEIHGINTPEQLKEAERLLSQRNKDKPTTF